MILSPIHASPPGLSRDLGRSTDRDIIVTDLGVSKQHAELRRSPASRYSIIDLGRHNGTYANGTRVIAPRPFTPASVGALLADAPLQAAAEAVLTLALAHRAALLA